MSTELLATPGLRTVRLHGQLGRLYGRSYELSVRDVGEAIRALCYQLKGDPSKKIAPFVEYLTSRKREFMILRGDQYLTDTEHLDIGLGKVDEIHIVPKPRGDKSGAGKFILGIFLVGASFITAGATGVGLAGGLGPAGAAAGFVAPTVTFGQIAALGGLFALGGISQMLAPNPDVADPTLAEVPEERPSFLINSITNTTEEGGVVPVPYGFKVRTGSHVISAGLAAEQVPLVDVLASEIDTHVTHLMRSIDSGVQVCSGDDLQVIGWSSSEICDEDPANPFPIVQYGTMSPLTFRDIRLTQVFERHNTVTDEYHLVVVSLFEQPRNWFDIIRIRSNDNLTTYFEKATSGALVEQIELTSVFSQNAKAINPMTRWSWLIGTGGGFTMPTTNPDDSDRLRVRFSY